MFAREEGDPGRPGRLRGRIREAVAEVVRKQVDAGIDIVNDGEASKPSYATYVKDRLTGFGGESARRYTYARPAWTSRSMAKRVFGDPGRSRRKTPACTGPIGVRDPGAAEADVDNLKAAPRRSRSDDVFVSAASPGVISLFFRNDHYRSHEAYLVRHRRRHAPRVRGDRAGRVHPAARLPRPGHGPPHPVRRPQPRGVPARWPALHVEALNHALADIPPEQLRMHLCWGNYEGPHHYDVPLGDILDIVFAAPARRRLVRGAPTRATRTSGRCSSRVKLPADKVIIPGVIDSTTNFIEHPELVAAAHRALRARWSAARTSSPAPTAASAPGSVRPRSTPTSPGPSWAPRRGGPPGLPGALVASVAGGHHRRRAELHAHGLVPLDPLRQVVDPGARATRRKSPCRPSLLAAGPREGGTMRATGSPPEEEDSR